MMKTQSFINQKSSLLLITKFKDSLQVTCELRLISNSTELSENSWFLGLDQAA